VQNDDDLATKLFDKATAEHAELVVVAGEHKGKTVSLGAGTVVIGRGSDCELPLKGTVGASRRHCKVQYLGNRFVVIDLESRNGTVVNGQSVERKVLEPNDKIEIGDEVIQFIVHRLADLGLIDDSMSSPFDETNSKTMRVPPPVPDDSFANPLLAAVELAPAVRVVPEAPPAPTRSSSSIPVAMPMAAPAAVAQTTPPTPPPTPTPAPAPTTSRSMWVFAAASMSITAVATILVYDVVTTPKIDPKTIAALVVIDAGPVVAAPVAVTAPVVAPVVDAGSAVVDAGVVADAGGAVVDAGVLPVAAVVTAGVEAAVPASAGAATISATAAGRALAVKVGVGARVAAGDVVVVVGSDPGTLPRKLEALRREEREFADAARSDPSLAGDLEQVRREIKRIQSRLETKAHTATQAGVVVEVLVKAGDAVTVGMPLVRLQ
jgi:hypothetical protein